ncbi:carboxyl transferase domain-containing protein [uncultured Paludibaculum sp.]|uniref:acyl-CoA carboxylase subunit beta n=1 Tax=uncultured Paludibaculum sp. TaxID=1765020 RepID=UPI002AABAEDC|nr:carboxyl transferase domain-containing protein [uncultured Paludibaculum sp.]
MRLLLRQLRELEECLQQGGGKAKADRQHRDGKLTARERVARLVDPSSPLLEIGLLVAYDSHEGKAPAAGVITLLARVEGRPVVIVANDATVKAGAWWPETITKILRAQEIAMRNRLPIVYLVDSAGVNLPLQDGIFPGQYGAARIFYYNSLMRRRLRIPQIAAVMGPCIAGGAYLPALSDVIFMVERTSFMGLGGPNLVKGATGQVTDSESLGGARLHTTISGVAHHMAADDPDCLRQIRAHIANLPPAPARPAGSTAAKPSDDLYDILPDDHRQAYDIMEIVDRLLDASPRTEFQPDFAPEMYCLEGKLHGRAIGLIGNRRGFLKSGAGPRIGGIVYTETARKVSYFVEYAERRDLPLLYLQDVSGFMVGPDAEASGIIRAGAEMVESMACATVPKIILTLNHASGAGYYAMAGQGFDPNFTFAWPTARIGVMEGDSAVQAVHGVELDKLKAAHQPVPPELQQRIDTTRADYENWLDARHAAARGHVDAILDPLETRLLLAFAFECACASGHRGHTALEVLGS